MQMPPRKKSRNDEGTSSTPHQFRLLDAVEIFDGYDWRRGKVTAIINDGRYQVAYDESTERFCVTRDRIRAATGEPSASGSPRARPSAGRPREPSASQPPRASSSGRPSSSSRPTTATSRPPWPRRDERAKIRLSQTFEGEYKAITESAACTQRPISDTWDDYDSIFYNAWLDVEIKPTRFADPLTMRHLGFDVELQRLLEKIGLGTMSTKWYPLYPDLVRQFLASVRVYYTGEAPVTAQQGVLTFMIRGVRYRLPFQDLCSIYGFRRNFSRCELPTKFLDVQNFWRHFGHGQYHSKTTTQMDIRHPVLRCLARILSNTLMCKMEPNKMRVSELIVLSMAIGDIIDDEEYEWPQLDLAVNLGAVFAHHLESLKVKPFTSRGRSGKTSGRAKSESVGSLLTPIFLHFGIDVSSCSIVSTRAVMDEPHLEHLRWLKPGRRWVFSTSQGDFLVQLPNTDLTDIGSDASKLLFTPSQADMVRAPVTRRRGMPSGSHTAAGEDTPAPPTPASPAPPLAPAPAPTFPAAPSMDLDPFQQYVVQSLQAIWSTISRCSCMTPSTSRSRRTAPAAGPSRTAGGDDTDYDSEYSED